METPRSKNPLIRDLLDRSISSLRERYPQFDLQYKEMTVEEQNSLLKKWNLGAQRSTKEWQELQDIVDSLAQRGVFREGVKSTNVLTMSFQSLLRLSPDLQAWFETQNTFVQQQVVIMWRCGKIDPRIEPWLKSASTNTMLIFELMDSSLDAVRRRYPTFNTKFNALPEADQKKLRVLWNMASRQESEFVEELQHKLEAFASEKCFEHVLPPQSAKDLSFTTFVDSCPALKNWLDAQNQFAVGQISSLWRCGFVDNRIEEFVQNYRLAVSGPQKNPVQALLDELLSDDDEGVTVTAGGSPVVEPANFRQNQEMESFWDNALLSPTTPSGSLTRSALSKQSTNLLLDLLPDDSVSTNPLISLPPLRITSPPPPTGRRPSEGPSPKPKPLLTLARDNMLTLPPQSPELPPPGGGATMMKNPIDALLEDEDDDYTVDNVSFERKNRDRAGSGILRESRIKNKSPRDSIVQIPTTTPLLQPLSDPPLLFQPASLLLDAPNNATSTSMASATRKRIVVFEDAAASASGGEKTSSITSRSGLSPEVIDEVKGVLRLFYDAEITDAFKVNFNDVQKIFASISLKINYSTLSGYNKEIPFPQFCQLLEDQPDWENCTLMKKVPASTNVGASPTSFIQTPFLQRLGMYFIHKTSKHRARNAAGATPGPETPAPAEEEFNPDTLGNSLRVMSRWACLRAALYGLGSAIASGLLELWVDNLYPDADQSPWDGDPNASYDDTWRYWVLLLSFTVIVSVIEMMILYIDAMITSLRMGEVGGFAMGSKTKIILHLNSAYARNALELGHPTHQFFSINPLKKKKPFIAAMQMVLYKAKTTVIVFTARLMFKRVMSRAAAKGASPFAATPVLMLMNALMMFFLMEEAICITVGLRGVCELCPLWFANRIVPFYLRVNILQSIGCVIVLREDLHPSLEWAMLTLDSLFGKVFREEKDTPFDEWRTAIVQFQKVKNEQHRKLLAKSAILSVVLTGTVSECRELLQGCLVSLGMFPGLDRVRALRDKVMEGNILNDEDFDACLEGNGVQNDVVRPWPIRLWRFFVSCVRFLFGA
eukprot:PhF_6_TR36536/c0_g1_i1/m.53880